MRWTIVAVAIAAWSVGEAQAQAAPPAWLSGCWEQQRGTRTTVEMWMPPLGGAMVGASRTVVAEQMRAFEFLRIVARGDTLVYAAQPNGREPTEFRSVAMGPDSVRFENRGHDFPQVIAYRRTAADSVVARIEGPGEGGSTQAIDFPFRRVPCTT